MSFHFYFVLFILVNIITSYPNDPQSVILLSMYTKCDFLHNSYYMFGVGSTAQCVLYSIINWSSLDLWYSILRQYIFISNIAQDTYVIRYVTLLYILIILLHICLYYKQEIRGLGKACQTPHNHRYLNTYEFTDVHSYAVIL